MAVKLLLLKRTQADGGILASRASSNLDAFPNFEGFRKWKELSSVMSYM